MEEIVHCGGKKEKKGNRREPVYQRASRRQRASEPALPTKKRCRSKKKSAGESEHQEEARPRKRSRLWLLFYFGRFPVFGSHISREELWSFARCERESFFSPPEMLLWSRPASSSCASFASLLFSMGVLPFPKGGAFRGPTWSFIFFFLVVSIHPFLIYLS